MKQRHRTRRDFIKQSAGGLAAAGIAAPWVVTTPVTPAGRAGTPAILGGDPVHKGKWPAPWPLYSDNVFSRLGEVLRTDKWTRVTGDLTIRFEQAVAKKFGVSYCVGTNTG